MDYVYLPELAPTKEIRETYKKSGGDWNVYESMFLKLMAERAVENTVDPKILDGGVLLCSEHEPDRCHRRLVAEYLNEKWDDNTTIKHLIE